MKITFDTPEGLFVLTASRGAMSVTDADGRETQIVGKTAAMVARKVVDLVATISAATLEGEMGRTGT